MRSEELRALQTPLKERYRADPEAAAVTLSATGAESATTGHLDGLRERLLVLGQILLDTPTAARSTIRTQLTAEITGN